MIYIGIILFFIFEYIRPSDLLPFLEPLHLNTILPGLLLVGSIFTHKGFSIRVISKSRNFRYMIAYMFFFVVSTVFARVHYSAVLTFKSMLGYMFIFFILVRNINTLSKLKGVLVILVFVHLFLIVLNAHLFANFHDRSYLLAGYFLGDGNDFALSLNIVVPLCLLLLFEARRKVAKLFYGVTLLLFIGAIILTQSRGGSLALAATTFYICMNSRKKLLSFALLGVGAVLLLALATPQYLDRMSTITNYDTESSAHARTLAWNSAIRMAIDHPLNGIGPGGFPNAFGMFYRPPGVGRTQMRWMNAHSIYFQLLGEVGFPALALLLVIFLSNMRTNFRIARALYGDEKRECEFMSGKLYTHLNGSLIGLAVAGAFLSALYYPHLYVVAALSTAAQLIHADMEKKEKSELFQQKETPDAAIAPFGTGERPQWRRA